jgi:hypothetical protein
MSGIHDGDVHDGDLHDADLETRVQAALRVRAERVTLGPDGVDGAWARTVARKRRSGGLVPGGHVPGGRRARKARRWAAPLAAAATVAVIGAGIGVAASGHPGGTGAVAAEQYSATVVSGAPGLTGPDPATLKSSPPITQVVLVRQVFGASTSWTYLWFADVGWLSAGRKSLVACTETYVSEPSGTPRQTATGCNPPALGASLVSPFGFLVGQSSAFDQFGVALRPVTSVTMQSDPDTSEKIPATLIDGRGFPYKIFIVAFPAKTNVENWKLVAREADGKQDSVPIPVASALSHPPSSAPI